MIRKAQILSLVILITLIFGTIQSVGMFTPSPIELVDDVNSSSIVVDTLIPDPFFTQSPDVVINGTSDEFSSSHHVGSGESDVSYVELNWTHIPGTVLDFIGDDPEDIMPDYNDFIYCYQEFEWPYEALPGDVRGIVNYSTYLSGDFANITISGNLQFRLYVWVIDSSGEWTRLYESREATYNEEYQSRRFDLNYFALQNVFAGMVEQDGVQEDPEDTARLVIGLSPRYTFNSGDPARYEWFEGTVSFRIGYADLYFSIDDGTTPTWQPMYNNTYSTTLGDVFPTHPNATDEMSDEVAGLVVDQAGDVYITGTTRSPYELYIGEGLRFVHQYLAKYSSTLDLLWEVKNDNMTEVRAMTFDDGYIYTTGFNWTESEDRNLIVTKWSTTGNRVWQSEWGANGTQFGTGITVDEDGTIYVIATDYDYWAFPGYYNTSILTYDNAGNLLEAQQTQHPVSSFAATGDLFLVEDELYYQEGRITVRIAMNGTVLGFLLSDAITHDNEGNIYLAYFETIPISSEATQIVLEKFNSTVDLQWNATFSVIWATGWFRYLVPRDIVITPADTILVLAQQYNLGVDMMLLSFDLQGNLTSNQTLGSMFEYWPPPGSQIYMEVGKSGLVYCAFTVFDTNLNGRILAFEGYQMPSGFDLSILTVIIIASSVVIIGSVAGIVRWKRRPAT